MRGRWAAGSLVAACLVLLVASGPAVGQEGGDERAMVERIVVDTVRPLMERSAIPGMAVGVVVDGRRRVFHFGVASRATAEPVGDATLFEIGSVSKTFTATLAAYAEVTGRLALSDRVGARMPALRGSAFDAVRLQDLATHTTGGLPLQVPAEVTDDDRLMGWLREWRPSEPPGSVRRYGNPGIGLLGRIAAASLDDDFVVSMERRLFPALGLKDTFIDVPRARFRDYAQGYTNADVPIRMAPGVLWAEAYGVRTTAGDLLRFVEANLGMLALDARWQRAVVDTHVGYARVGAMTQDLIWEQYDDPTALADLLAGNSARVESEPNAVEPLVPPSRPRDDVLIDKTGSTNGFSTYVAFMPARRIGIVLLANKRYPVAAAVTAGFDVLTALQRLPGR